MNKIKRIKFHLSARYCCIKEYFLLINYLKMSKNIYIAKSAQISFFCFLSLPTKKLEEKVNIIIELLNEKEYLYESHYSDLNNLSITIGWKILSILKPESKKIAYILAGSYEKANMIDEAIQVYNFIIESNSKKNNKTTKLSTLNLSNILWKRNKHENALNLLMTVKDDKTVNNKYLYSLHSLSIRNGLLLLEQKDFISGESILYGGLTGLEHNTKRTKKIISIYEIALGKDDSTRDNQGLPNINDIKSSDFKGSLKNELTPIIISGFGWSGSGAIFDFLKGFDNVGEFVDGREFDFWSGPLGLFETFKSLKSNMKKRKLLLEFIAYYCFGHILPGVRGKNLDGLYNWLNDEQKDFFLDSLLCFVSSLNHVNSDKELINLFRSFNQNLMKSICKDSDKYILFNNCITSTNIEAADLFCQPIVIVSWRDPRDSYVSKKLAFPKSKLSLEMWQSQLLKRINLYIKGKSKALDSTKLWLDISFEEFVNNSSVRNNLLENLSLENCRNSKSFDEVISKKNIGIYSQFKQANSKKMLSFCSKIDNLKSDSIKLNKNRSLFEKSDETS